MKNWRQGGPPPSVDFTELRSCLINGWAISHGLLKIIWEHILLTVEANQRFSTRPGTLIPYWSFLETLEVVIHKLEDSNELVKWWILPILCLEEATPGNWEFIHMI